MISFMCEDEGPLEHLRYAQVISIIRFPGNEQFDERDRLLDQLPKFTHPIIVTIYCPNDLNAEVWSKHNIGRMQTFGIKAVYHKRKK